MTDYSTNWRQGTWLLRQKGIRITIETAPDVDYQDLEQLLDRLEPWFAECAMKEAEDEEVDAE